MHTFGKSLLKKILANIFEKDNKKTLTSQEREILDAAVENFNIGDVIPSENNPTSDFVPNRSAVPALIEFCRNLYCFYIQGPDGVYEFIELYSKLEQDHDRISKIKFSQNQLDIAIRICSIAYHNEEVDHLLTKDELNEVFKWQYNDIKDLIALKESINNFEEYWDEVLYNYKRPNARINRIHYLIQKIEEFEQHPLIRKFQEALPMLDKLKLKYTSQLSQ